MSLTKKKNITTSGKARKKPGLDTSDIIVVTHTVVPAKKTLKVKKINEMLRNAKLLPF
ncbi:MAG TPA: hypothetical protein VK563_03875 [Puia sp.]|nr:hypothetical protein [Puia sp.]